MSCGSAATRRRHLPDSLRVDSHERARRNTTFGSVRAPRILHGAESLSEPSWLGGGLAVDQVGRAVEVILSLERRADLLCNPNRCGVLGVNYRDQMRYVQDRKRVVAHRSAQFRGIAATPGAAPENPADLEPRPTLGLPQPATADQLPRGSLND